MPVLPLQRDLFGRRAPTALTHTSMHTPPPGESWRRALSRRRSLLAASVALAFAAAGVLLWCRQPLYRATASVVVQTKAPASGLAARAAGWSASPMAISTAAQELASREMVQAALGHLGPQADGLLAPPLRHPLWLERLWPKPTTPLERVEAVRRRLHVTTTPYSRILGLSFTAPRPELATAFLHALVTADADRGARRQRAAGMRRVAYLQIQVRSARARVQDSVQAVATVAAQEGLTDPATEMQVAGRRWQQLAAAETQAEVSALQQTNALARRAPPPAAATGSDVAVPGDVYVQQAQLAAEVQRLAAQYRPQALPMRQARAQLAAVNVRIAQ
ncbi:MAG: hypothetical protein ACRD1Y_14775, partial [Terriglobales bacterium]